MSASPLIVVGVDGGTPPVASPASTPRVVAGGFARSSPTLHVHEDRRGVRERGS